MAVQAGKNLILKVGVGGTPVAVAALRSTGFSANGQTVDVTNRDSAGMRELLAAAGIASVSLSAEAVVTDNAQVTDFYSKTVAQSVDPYTLLFSNGDKLEGNFQVTKFDLKGNYNGEQLYSLSLESSGAMTLTAAA